jgi:CSLREA domain-containing protein
LPNTSSDEYDTSPNATCSLREAVQTFNTFINFGGCTHTGDFGTADAVELPIGHYTLTIPATGPDDNSSGDLEPGTITVQSAPGATVTIDGNNTNRIFFASDLTLDGLTLTGGNASDPDPLTGFNGGAIFTTSGGSLTITDSTISGNSTDSAGGGIAANGPTSLTNVTISGNTTTGQGGGGLDAAGTSLALDHVTISDNHNTNTSAAISIVAGGLYTQATTATVHNSVIAGNTSANTATHAPDCQGTLTSGGGNVIGDASGCTVTPLTSDAVGTQMAPVNPLLGPLANNGGVTFTHGLLAGSPAIDRGVAVCAAADQRGVARPQGLACDSGAVELIPPPTSGGDGTAQPGTTLAPNPLCATLQKKLKKAKRAHNKAKVRKLRRKLRRLGC